MLQIKMKGDCSKQEVKHFQLLTEQQLLNCLKQLARRGDKECRISTRCSYPRGNLKLPWSSVDLLNMGGASQSVLLPLRTIELIIRTLTTGGGVVKFGHVTSIENLHFKIRVLQLLLQC